MKKTTIIYISAIVLVLLALGGVLLFSYLSDEDNAIVTSYDECVKAGNPILETYPETCKTKSGQTFTRPVVAPVAVDMSNLIVVDTPLANATIQSPLVITGKARGSFFFEGSFPVKVIDAAGNVLGTGVAKAGSDWMTDGFVPFKATLTFDATGKSVGTLVLHNDNPSGLPENDKELDVPVKFSGIVSYTPFGSAIAMKPGDKIYFSDSLVVTLKTIDDSRCKPGVQCIWAGELAPVLIVGKAQSEVHLGTLKNQSVAFGNYTFTLKSATESSATIVVTKN